MTCMVSNPASAEKVSDDDNKNNIIIIIIMKGVVYRLYDCGRNGWPFALRMKKTCINGCVGKCKGVCQEWVTSPCRGGLWIFAHR